MHIHCTQNSKQMKKARILGVVIGISAMALAWTFYGWELTLVLTLAMWGNNIEQRYNK